jgi:hypothetical protein
MCGSHTICRSRTAYFAPQTSISKVSRGHNTDRKQYHKADQNSHNTDRKQYHKADQNSHTNAGFYVDTNEDRHTHTD